jgi:hypothetical protein
MLIGVLMTVIELTFSMYDFFVEVWYANFDKKITKVQSSKYLIHLSFQTSSWLVSQ